MSGSDPALEDETAQLKGELEQERAELEQLRADKLKTRAEKEQTLEQLRTYSEPQGVHNSCVQRFLRDFN